jgi:hypothetical protein
VTPLQPDLTAHDALKLVEEMGFPGSGEELALGNRAEVE